MRIHQLLVRLLYVGLGLQTMALSPVQGHATGLGDPVIQRNFQIFEIAQHKRRGTSDSAFGNALGLQYVQLFSAYQHSPVLEKQSANDTELLFRAAHATEFYSHQFQLVEDMRADLKQLERSGAATRADYADMYRSLIDVRDFDSARAYFATHPSNGLAPLPVIGSIPVHTTDKLTHLVVDSAQHSLRHEAFHPSLAPHILVIGHPLCHFTRQAVEDIETNPATKHLFAAHARWLAPQDGRIPEDFQVFISWNTLHPDEAMSFAYRESDWPLLDTWATPTFYFIKDGKVAAKLAGWPDEGNIPALTDAARKIGLMK